MSITITGGITFGNVGGVSIIAPPYVATASWYASNAGTATTRITYATDTATSTNRGFLSVGLNSSAAGTGTLTDGWFGGGYTVPAPAPFTGISTVQRITFATDTATLAIRGPLTLGRYRLGASTDSTTYGWWGGGYTRPQPSPRSTVDRITYATDTATATARGPLDRSAYSLAGTGTTTDAWYCGGRNNNAPAVNYSTVSRINYATDTATASAKGPLTSTASGAAATSDGTTYGWVTVGNGSLSTVNRITYATDTATASVRGPMNGSTYEGAGTGNSTYGYFACVLFPASSIVQRITFATDTATASAMGPTTATTFKGGGVSGVQ